MQSKVEALSKPRREKSTTKDKLIGIQVINGDGNLIGTIKDVGFAVGKPGVSLIVEGKNGETQDVTWENIQGAADYVVLKPTTQAAASPLPAAQPAQTTQTLCPTCGQPLTYIKEYQRWYCYKEGKYV
jgi:sporulation protein YlmC with PRC-barrel domain